MSIKNLKAELMLKSKSFRNKYFFFSGKRFYNKDINLEMSLLISSARAYKGITQTELAGIVGTQQPSIARMEKGESLPSLSFLKKVADALGTFLVPPQFAFMSQIDDRETETYIWQMYNHEQPSTHSKVGIDASNSNKQRSLELIHLK